MKYDGHIIFKFTYTEFMKRHLDLVYLYCICFQNDRRFSNSHTQKPIKEKCHLHFSQRKPFQFPHLLTKLCKALNLIKENHSEFLETNNNDNILCFKNTHFCLILAIIPELCLNQKLQAAAKAINKTVVLYTIIYVYK